MELERGVTVHLSDDEWVHMRAWPRIGVLVNGLRKLFDNELESELEQPGFGGKLSSFFSLSQGITDDPRAPTGPVSSAVDAMLECISRDGSLH